MDKKGHHYTNRGHDVNKMAKFGTILPFCVASGKGSTLMIPVVTSEFDRRRMRGLMPSLGQRPGNWKEIVELWTPKKLWTPTYGNWGNYGCPKFISAGCMAADTL